MSRPRIAAGDRLVVKVGSASLVDSTGEPDERRLKALCGGLTRLHRSAAHPILVSSGAIAAGLGPLGLERRPSDIPSLQAAAAVGQRLLLGSYARLLAASDIVVAQVLLTRYDFMHRQQYLNARNTLDRLLALKALPVVNENDTVAVDEIRFGDNDMLAALVANVAHARLLVLLTNARGVHAADPRRNPDAPVIEEVRRITPELERAAGGRGSEHSSGGMTSKIAAAWVATFSGVAVVVADASEPDVLGRIARGEALGTYFHPRPKRESARRLWIAFARPPTGTIEVDDGARKALVEDKRSLLPVGVTAASGEFAAGDAVDVSDRSGTVFARGLVRFSAPELQGVKGRSTAGVEGGEVIHRDQLVVLED
ncbi:MAG: glutamate 5-kinase [Actinomycetota bacterium]|nr:glutamate 5-kinase [Actinomycetota bacterium]